MGINAQNAYAMYKSTYLSVRIHTEDEAVDIQPDGDADTFLWLIDVYDLGESAKCAQGVKKLILSKYFELHERVPGMLPRWTKGMMAWITYLNALVPCYTYDESWVIANNLMIAKHPEEWSWMTCSRRSTQLRCDGTLHTHLTGLSSNSTCTVSGVVQKMDYEPARRVAGRTKRRHEIQNATKTHYGVLFAFLLVLQDARNARRIRASSLRDRKM